MSRTPFFLLIALPIAPCFADESAPPARPTLGFVEVPSVSPAGPSSLNELPAPRPVSAVENVLTLQEALQRAGIANPTIGVAREGIVAGEALRLQARAMLLPHVVAGVNVRLHHGNLQGGSGIITRPDLNSLFVGAGAEARGAGTTTIPGVRLLSHLGDALFEPRLAELRLSGLQSETQAITRAVLTDVMNRYVSLTAANARFAALRQTVEELNEVSRITRNFAAAGQGREGDAQRANAELLLVQAEYERLQGDQLSAAADLARYLDLDPSIPLRPADNDPPLLEWIDPTLPLETLIPEAVRQRPELHARSASIAFSQTRIRQERVRPWLPTLSIGYSAGTFGGGGTATQNSFSSFGSREDFDAYAVWTLRGMGLGNYGEVQRAAAQMRIAEADYARMLDEVRRQTASALSLARFRKQEISLARSRLENATRAFELDLQRTKNLQGRPIEVLNSIQLLSAARQDLINAMAAYSQAQIDLLFAIGRDVGNGYRDCVH